MIGLNPHGAAVPRHHPGMERSRFTFWTTTGDRLPVPWDEAMTRLDETPSARLRRAGAGVRHQADVGPWQCRRSQ